MRRLTALAFSLMVPFSAAAAPVPTPGPTAVARPVPASTSQPASPFQQAPPARPALPPPSSVVAPSFVLPPSPATSTSTAATTPQSDKSVLDELLQLRDPFKRPGSGLPNAAPKTGLEVYAAGSLKMIGILTGPRQVRAMLLAPDGKTFMVSERMKAGQRDGIIQKITTSKVLIREKVTNLLGQIENVDTLLNLQPESSLQALSNGSGSVVEGKGTMAPPQTFTQPGALLPGLSQSAAGPSLPMPPDGSAGSSPHIPGMMNSMPYPDAGAGMGAGPGASVGPAGISAAQGMSMGTAPAPGAGVAPNFSPPTGGNSR